MMTTSPTLTLVTACIIGLCVCMQFYSCHAVLSAEDNAKIQEMVEMELTKHYQNKSMPLSEAFRQATGHRLETVVIITVLIMTIPSLLINLIFLALQWILQSGSTVVCCCCKLGMEAGGKAVCSCCKALCNQCPGCGKSPSSEETPLLQDVEKQK